MLHRLLILLALAAGFTLLPAQAFAQSDWPAVFNPEQVRTLNLEMDPADWDTIRFDTTNEIEVPARLSQSGEEPIVTSVRRKSSRALPSETDPQKVGLKVDINEFVDGQVWHGLEKLSLENGSDTSPVAEGVAWNLHEMATGEGFYPAGYHPGLASWANVNVNGEPKGVYVNVEQRDKQMLRNRGLYDKATTWLYEIDDINGYALEAGDPHSPTYSKLCYSPFQTSGPKGAGTCKTPSDADLERQLRELIGMDAMLTQGAVDAFSNNDDALFSHGKNYHFADFAESRGLKRMNFPWDLDAAIRGDVNGNIYGKTSGKRLVQSPFQSVMLNHPSFRNQYNAILLGLTNGPLSEGSLNAFVDRIEPGLSQALREDPYAGVNPDEEFPKLREWLSTRITKVQEQAAANKPAPR